MSYDNALPAAEKKGNTNMGGQEIIDLS